MPRKWMMTTGLSVILVVSVSQAGDWTQFRGPDGSGVSPDGLPTEWSPSSNVSWKVKLPGFGWSAPVIVGDKVFVTTADTDKLTKPKNGGFGGPGKGDVGKGGFPKGGLGKGGKAPDVVYRWQVVCLDRATGKELWKQTAAEHKPS